MIGETPSDEMAETLLCIESSLICPASQLLGPCSRLGRLTMLAVNDDSVQSGQGDDLGMSN
jgi:hypothetical protein